MDILSVRDDLTAEGPAVDKNKLRGVCGLFVTGVTIITSLADGHPVGLTVNSFTSVSLDPPLVLFCVHRMSRIWPAVKSAGRFAVNILAADQAEVCRDFATKRSSHFARVSCRAGHTGVPILKDALAYLECSLHCIIDGGDHIVVLGQVLDLGVQRDESPLTFFRSGHPRLENL